MVWTAPRTWVTGELVTATLLNTHLKDNLNAIVPVGPDGWSTWTPVITQLGTVGHTVTRATYTKVGRLLVVSADLAITGTGTGNNAITVSGWPFTAASAAMMMGSFRLFDAS